MSKFNKTIDRTILVTGGCGFIGSHFIKYILSKYDNYKIINLDNLSYCANFKNLKEIENNKNYVFVKGDILDSVLLEKILKNVDWIVNFAAQSHVDNSIKNPSIFAKTNILGTLNLLEIAKINKIKKFLQISTDEVYGSIKTGYFDESAPLNPKNPYSISKAAADMYVINYFKTYNLPVLITRSSNNFGKYQYPEKLIPLFVSKLSKNEKVPLYGSGLQKRDWLYVLDNCSAIDLVLHKGEIGEIYNISSHIEKTNLEITRLILKHLNKNETMIDFVPDRLQHDERYGISNNKIKSLGWQARTNFEEKLAETIDWNKNNQSHFIVRI